MVKYALSVYDYIVFGLVLVLSSIIGIYFARKGQKKRQGDESEQNVEEYLVAGRSMHWFPLSISFMATYVSGTSLLGIPAEIYTYGFGYILSCNALLVATFITWYIFIPVFYRLKIVSANEYLERRFTTGIRSMGCVIMCFYMLSSLSVGLYAPALAMEAVGGVPVYISVTVTGLVCAFYTTIGGMKAVVWTDCFQAFVMIGGLLVVIIIGVNEVGSIPEIFRRAKQGERMNFDFNPDPRIRNTFWSLIFGVAFTILPAWAVGQQSVQRFQAAKSLKEARLALLWNFPSMVFISLLAMLAGLVIYAVYADCDIGVSGLGIVTRNDQVLPYFIIQKLGHLKGISGLFMAVLFSSALSSVSSSLNALSAILLEDFVRKVKPNLSASNATKASMLIACVTGFIGIGFSFLISKVGGLVTQISFTLIGALGSPYLGLFTLGIMVPWANWKGAYTGFALGLGTTVWLATGAIFYPPNSFPAVLHVNGCAGFNSTNTTNPVLKGSGIIRPSQHYVSSSDTFSPFYSISYLWYGAIGCFITVTVGCLSSLVFNYFSDYTPIVEKELLFEYPFGRCRVQTETEKSKNANNNKFELL